MRKAKIICTLGPATDGPGVLEALVRAGMDVARLNFSHGTPEDHRRRFRALRAVATKAGRNVAVLQDLQGPKIRLGRFEGGQIDVHDGETVTVTTRKTLGRPGLIPTPVTTLTRDVKPGDPLLLDDGRVRLRAEAVRGPDVQCRVEIGGPLKDHKGLNLPNSHVSVPSLTAKDLRDLALGRALGVDYVALSFVRTANDIRKARARAAPGTPIIAKIEKPQAVDNLDAIANEADGVMIARGDLGVELPLERLPGIQKAAVAQVNRMGKLAIVATEMLESMVHSPRPTRAEVSDVANAILDGADAVMLSGETAAGDHPANAALMMSRIVEETERSCRVPPRATPFERSMEITTGMATAAVAAAQQLGIETIVAYTESGYTARLISEFRPRASIVALTPNPEVVRRTALYWGVTAYEVPRLRSTDAMISQVRHLCRAQGICRRGSAVAIVAGVPLNQPGNTNLLSIHRM